MGQELTTELRSQADLIQTQIKQIREENQRQFHSINEQLKEQKEILSLLLKEQHTQSIQLEKSPTINSASSSTDRKADPHQRAHDNAPQYSNEVFSMEEFGVPISSFPVPRLYVSVEEAKGVKPSNSQTSSALSGGKTCESNSLLCSSTTEDDESFCEEMMSKYNRMFVRVLYAKHITLPQQQQNLFSNLQNPTMMSRKTETTYEFVNTENELLSPHIKWQNQSFLIEGDFVKLVFLVYCTFEDDGNNVGEQEFESPKKHEKQNKLMGYLAIDLIPLQYDHFYDFWGNIACKRSPVMGKLRINVAKILHPNFFLTNTAPNTLPTLLSLPIKSDQSTTIGVEIIVIEATGIWMENKQSVSQYVEIIYGSNLVQRTTPVEQGVHPRWNKYVMLKGAFPEITFLLLDSGVEDEQQSNVEIGRANFSTSSLRLNEESDIWLKLTSPTENNNVRDVGNLHIRAILRDDIVNSNLLSDFIESGSERDGVSIENIEVDIHNFDRIHFINYFDSIEGIDGVDSDGNHTHSFIPQTSFIDNELDVSPPSSSNPNIHPHHHDIATHRSTFINNNNNNQGNNNNNTNMANNHTTNNNDNDGGNAKKSRIQKNQSDNKPQTKDLERVFEGLSLYPCGNPLWNAGIEVYVMEAQNLPKKIGLTEPYVRILYGPDITVRTKHVHKNSNPKWHKHFVLKGLYPKIIFEVFSFSILGRDLFIGWVSFDIRSLRFDKQIDFWSNIRQGNDSPGGGKLHYKLVVRKDISVAPIVPDVNLHLLNRKSKKELKEKDDLDIDSFVMIPNPIRTLSKSEQMQRSNLDINMKNVALEITIVEATNLHFSGDAKKKGSRLFVKILNDKMEMKTHAVVINSTSAFWYSHFLLPRFSSELRFEVWECKNHKNKECRIIGSADVKLELKDLQFDDIEELSGGIIDCNGKEQGTLYFHANLHEPLN